MSQLGNPVPASEAYAQSADHWRGRSRELARQEDQLRLGGGAEALERQHERGKKTARERVATLLDPGAAWLEVGLWSAWGQYAEWGGAPSAGVVVGVGPVHGRDVVVVANDSTVKAGAWFPATCKKVLRAQEIALENRLPIVYLVDSAGVFLPLQDEVFPDRDHFGRAFYNNAQLSAAGVFQVAAILGSCVAGGAYLPIMSDEAHIVEGMGSIFLAGAHLVRAAIGEQVENEELGGALVQCDISGVVDRRHPDESSCLRSIRASLAQVGRDPVPSPFVRITPREPHYPGEDLYGLLPVERARPYDMREILARLLDASEIEEYKPTYGRSLICGSGFLDGWALGVVANQRQVVERRTGTATGERELQIGGVLYSDSADKGARFVELCNQKRTPILFVQDVTGFMVGTRAERGGIIKDGAKLVNAVANSTVPKLTLFVGNSFGAGNYAMCGKAYGARLLWAWPSAAISVMGPEQASSTLLSIQLRNRGSEVTEEEKSALLRDIRGRYEAAMDPRYAASRLWVDGIVDPPRTREVLAASLRAGCHNHRLEPFRTGVLQT
jgi:acetyl-CoA carboxylase carboxyltransferase component